MRFDDLARRIAVTGLTAAGTSAAAAALLARRRGLSAVRPTNATSHWLHGEAAGRYDDVDWSHTGLGGATHAGSAFFWAAIFETWLTVRPPGSDIELARDAAVMATIAAAADYGVVPRRVTPGWEEVLPPPDIAQVFGALALGLAVGAAVQDRPRR